MEILNRNKRRSALWRITALLGLLLVSVSTILFSMNQAYQGQGEEEVAELRDSLRSHSIRLNGRIQAMAQDTLRLTDVIDELRSDDKMSKKVEELEDELKEAKADLRTEEKANKKLRKKLIDLNYELGKANNSQ